MSRSPLESDASPHEFGDLDILARKLAAALPSEAQTHRQVSKGGASILGFRKSDGEGGVLVSRRAPQAPDASIGRIPLCGARGASAAMLSLLALDPDLAICDPSRALYFDTETTGLGGAGSLAFLIGLASFDSAGTLVLEQLLLQDPGHESAQLERLEEVISKASLLVSFNGKSFDWPLIQTRLAMNKRKPLASLPHLDLLHVSRRLHKRRLERFRLVDLEREVLGFERGSEDIPGADIPPLYAHYLRTRNEEVLRPVVEHNAWDILTMTALVALYGESLEELAGSDLLGLAETLTRAKSYAVAEVAVGRAMEEGGGPAALELRARLNKARGDKARALSDYVTLSAEVNDARVRLELAKLYEHHAKDYEGALATIVGGTGEPDVGLNRRRSRLERRRDNCRMRTAKKS